ncbi:MAG: GNAT family N-acetyltransferase [Alphaproteobacteria bacterium]|nr:GNAT family N-acetyltransferase [Alphaproteobacteria bacterium]OJV16041.1 MAG: hypothetical protein BGO27_04260 [Alphaproteobacteria bacterium 33-17]
MRDKFLKVLNNSGFIAKIINPYMSELLQKFIDKFDDFFIKCEGIKGCAENILEALPTNKKLEDKICIATFENENITSFIDLILEYPEKDTITIGYLLVNPEMRGKNIGSTIVKLLNECAIAENYFRLRCIVQENNQNALNFWQKNGFRIELENTNALNIKEFVLERDLI